MKQLLWTIQTEETYRKFVKAGILLANEDHSHCGDGLHFAYDWPSRQMASHIGSPQRMVVLETAFPHRIWHLYCFENNGHYDRSLKQEQSRGQQ